MIHVELPKSSLDKSYKYLKISDKEFEIPTINEYESVIKINYTIPMLKKICDFYNIHKTGNKEELIKKIFTFLLASKCIIKIQKKFRTYLSSKLKHLRGSAFNNRSICINDTDFLTMENINDIPECNFYSFTDDDKIIYGFDLSSLLTAINKDSNFRNPYNRKSLPISEIKKNINSIIRLNKIFNIKCDKLTQSNDDNINISIKKKIELKFLALCQKMDELGNYTDVTWFTSLERNQIIKFIRELHDIWMYRAQLTIDVKKNICPISDPCIEVVNLYELNIIHIDELKYKMIRLIENFIYKGINKDSQFLGASYVLSALTLVNENAAQSMPWLYYSVAHI